MKAAQISEYGEPEVIEINEVPEPEIKEEQVLVEVYAAALNPFDWKIRKGFLKDMVPLSLPITLGGDFSGVVTKAGTGVSGYTIGDELFGSALILNGGSGALAQYATVNMLKAAPKPKNATHEESAAVVLVGVSAVQALENHIQLKTGQKLLIHGGAGGIGSVAIQYAKHLGAYVATTVRGADIEFAKQLGADEVINYQEQAFEAILHDYDAVFDTVGGEVYTKSFMILKKEGILVSMNEQSNEALASKYGVKTVHQSSQIDSQTLKHVANLVDEGVIKVHVDRVFPLEQTAEAFRHLETGHPKGKVIVKLK